MTQEIQVLLLDLNIALTATEENIVNEVLTSEELAKKLESVRQY
jgi:hypothetical protein